MSSRTVLETFVASGRCAIGGLLSILSIIQEKVFVHCCLEPMYVIIRIIWEREGEGSGKEGGRI